MDILTGENCRQLRLLTRSLIGQFVHQVGREGMGMDWIGLINLTRYKFHFT